jgi:hypothetical protein
MNSMSSVPVDNGQDFPELTWKEHTRLFQQSIRSRRLFGIAFGISILLIFTFGIVFQIVFLFSFMQAFVTLAMLSQPFYSAFLLISNDKRLPRTLPKPPLFAYLSSIIPLFISAFFLYVGVVAFQKTGFCAQSLGCIIVTLIQSITG